MSDLCLEFGLMIEQELKNKVDDSVYQILDPIQCSECLNIEKSQK